MQVLSVQAVVVVALQIPFNPLKEVQGVAVVPVKLEHDGSGEMTHPYPLVMQVEEPLNF